MKIVAIIQARMSSERLPGKVLMPLGKKPVLAHVIGRLRHAATLADIVVATSDRRDDDPVADLARREQCSVYRGDLHDVLARFAGAADIAAAEGIVRITADCPLIAAEVVDGMVEKYIQESTAEAGPCVITNARVRTYPRGLDVEVFPRIALDMALRNATEPHQREHVTPYLYEHPEIFRIVDYTQSRNMAGARWTLDTAEDFQMLSEYFALLGDRDYVGLVDLVRVWDQNPELHAINANVTQRQYSRSQ